MRICTPHSAMTHTMVMASAIDAEMTDGELLRIGLQINCIPLFEDHEPDKLDTDAAASADLFVGDGGVDAAIDQIEGSPAHPPAQDGLRVRQRNCRCRRTLNVS